MLMTADRPGAASPAGATPGKPPKLQSAGFNMTAPAGDLWNRAVAAAEGLVGSHGLVRRCQARPATEGLPSLPVYVAIGPRRDTSGTPLRAVPLGTGVSDDAGEAWLQAVIEVVERYCMVWPHHRSSAIRAPIRDLGDNAIPASAFGLFSARQYASMPALRLPAPDDPIDWTWAWSLTRETFVLVPAVLALTAVEPRPPNNLIHGLSSTGVACHVSVEAAVLAGVLEVMERDAVMLWWLHRRCPTTVRVDSGASAVYDLLSDHFAHTPFDFQLLDLTSDTGFPTFACLARSEHPGRPAAVFGSATRLDPLSAARKALFEAAQILSSLAGLGCDGQSRLPAESVRTFEDHARYYASATTTSELDFIQQSSTRDLSSLDSVGCGTPGQDLRSVVSRLGELGLEVLAVDLTTPEVALAGLHTVKVLVPGAIDINADVRFPLLGSPRIHGAAKTLGWPAKTENELNLAPCPLP